MTVGVAYRVPGAGAVLVSDGRITDSASGELISDTARKFVVAGAAFCIVAGDVGPVWRQLQERPPRTFKAFRSAVETAEEPPDYLAYDRVADRLWDGPLRLSAPFFAIGTGGTFALGALEALPPARTLGEARKNALIAVRAAIRRNVLCGGRVRVLVVPRRGEITVR